MWPDFALDLCAVRVRPTRGGQRAPGWNRLVAVHCHPPFVGLFGRGLLHVATLDGAWLALPGWQVGALRVLARDRWIGWSAERQLRPLHRIQQNAHS